VIVEKLAAPRQFIRARQKPYALAEKITVMADGTSARFVQERSQ
jgi:hypothetical protein